MKWILSISFLFVGCVSIPRQTAQLTVLLGNQIAESKITHLNLIDEWAKERRARTEQFLEYRWIPTFIDNFMDPVGEPSKNLKSALKSDCRPVIADEIKEITSAVSKQIEKKRKELFDAIDAQAQNLKSAVTLHYAETERMHRAITSNVQSVVKGQEFEKQIRDAMARPLKEIVPIENASKALDKLFEEVK